MTFPQQLFLIILDKLLIGVLILLAALWVNKNLESFKILENRRAAHVTEQVKNIDKQLAEFYWPVTFRLEKDNAVWEKLLDPDKNLAKQVELDMILPNHREILKIIDINSNLIFNAWEPVNNEFVKIIKLYERHITVYSALRSMKDPRMPIEVNEPWPERFHPMVLARIDQLQKQRAQLIGK